LSFALFPLPSSLSDVSWSSALPATSIHSTAQATTSAYLSDVTPSGSRARIFSLLGGLMFFGIGVGPIFGSVVITLTHGNALAPFYVSLGLHAAYFVLAALVLPESLEKSRRENAKIRRVEEKEAERRRREEEHEGWANTAGRIALRPFAFLKPVALLLPRAHAGAVKDGEDEEDEEGRTNIEWGAGIEEYAHPEDVWKRKEGSKTSRDWTLTQIATAWFTYMGIAVRFSYSYSFLFSSFLLAIFFSRLLIPPPPRHNERTDDRHYP
jgi:hypothetical protein